MDESAPLIAVGIVAFFLAVAGVLMIWLAWAGRTGRLGRNMFVGIRTSATLSSDTAWHAAHRTSAAYTVSAGVGALAGAVATLAIRSTGALVVAVVATSVWMLVWVAVGAFVGTRAARRADTQTG